MGKGILGGMFDFDRDGRLNAVEQAAEFQFLHRMETEEEARRTRSAAGPGRNRSGPMVFNGRRAAWEDEGTDESDFDDDD